MKKLNKQTQKDKNMKKKTSTDHIRKPTAPPTIPHKDKNRYTRKKKHKKSYSE